MCFHFCIYHKYIKTLLLLILVESTIAVLQTVHVEFTNTRCETASLEAICSYLFLADGAWVKGRA